MIRFLSVSLRNFLSYGNNTTVIDIGRPGTTLIVGENLDNTSDGTSANGTGKSTIVNALAYAVYDKPVSDISKDNLINNVNKKHMEVSVDFEKSGDIYRIVRARKMRAGADGNYVHLFKNNEDITPDSISNTNLLIEKIVGIPYDLFVRIVVFSASHTPFLDLPVKSHYAANQTDMIEHLFGLTTLSDKANILKEQIKETEHKIEGHEIHVNALKKERERHEEQVKSAKARIINWEKQTKETITKFHEKLKLVEEVDVEQQRLLHEELHQSNELLKGVLEEQRVIEKDVKKALNEKKEAEGKLKHFKDDRCPECLQEYKGTDKIAEYEKLVANADTIITKLEKKLEVVDAEVELRTQNYKEIKGKITVQDIEELIDLKNHTASIREKIVELENAVNPYFEPLEELEHVDLGDIDYTELNELNRKVEHQRFLLKVLTKKDSFVRKVLLNKYLPFLNARLSEYIMALGLQHRVEFTHELIAEISQFGRKLDFGNLSAGQRARVNIALSFAFRDVLQSLHTPINVCMLDEVLDVGLDSVGVQMAAKMLKRKARDEKLSLYVISHRDEIDSAFDRTLTVQMEKGFSSIRE